MGNLLHKLGTYLIILKKTHTQKATINYILFYSVMTTPKSTRQEYIEDCVDTLADRDLVLPDNYDIQCVIRTRVFCYWETTPPHCQEIKATYIGEELIIHLVTEVLKSVVHYTTHRKIIAAIPLNNNHVQRRIAIWRHRSIQRLETANLVFNLSSQWYTRTGTSLCTIDRQKGKIYFQDRERVF